MAALFTIQEVIDLGNASLPYALNDYYKGSLFRKSIATQKSCIEIAMFTDILAWQYETSPDDETLRGAANYLIWLCGMFAMQAQSSSGGGSSVVPSNPTTNTFPLYIFGGVNGSNFESDGISYNNPNIVGLQLAIYPDQYSSNFLLEGTDTFSYTSTGIVINIPGFNANTQTWIIRVERWYGTIPTAPYPFIFDTTFDNSFN
jgi:hypothetical protein